MIKLKLQCNNCYNIISRTSNEEEDNTLLDCSCGGKYVYYKNVIISDDIEYYWNY